MFKCYCEMKNDLVVIVYFSYAKFNARHRIHMETLLVYIFVSSLQHQTVSVFVAPASIYFLYSHVYVFRIHSLFSRSLHMLH